MEVVILNRKIKRSFGKKPERWGRRAMRHLEKEHPVEEQTQRLEDSGYDSK